MRLLVLALLAAGLLGATGSGAAVAAEITDQFGQSVDAALDTEVETARQLRLPYAPDYDAPRAIAMLEEVVARRPDYYRAWFNLGLAYGENRDFANADRAFARALDIREQAGITDITILNSAGWVSMSGGDYDTAERYFTAGIAQLEQGSDFTRQALYNNLGLLYYYTQRFELAKEALEIARDRYGSQSAAETLALIDEALLLSSKQAPPPDPIEPKP